MQKGSGMPAELVIRGATDEQILESRRRHAPHWGIPLTTPQYLARERLLETEPFCEGHKYWVLTHPDRNDAIDFLCSCETYARRMLVSDEEGQQTAVVAFSVCSVFTPEAHRGHGHAALMMTLLQEKLKLMGAALSFLYSDIQHYYSRIGYRASGYREIYCPLNALPDSDVRCIDVGGTLEELESLATEDSALMVDDLSRAASHPSCVLLLDGKEFAWMIRRSKFYSVQQNVPLPPGNKEPTVFGARVSSSSLAYAVWWYDFKSSSIEILRWRCDSREQFVVLLGAIKRAGVQQGVEHFLAFADVPDSILPSELSQYHREMPCSWPALAWYGSGPPPHWLQNQKYGWC